MRSKGLWAVGAVLLFAVTAAAAYYLRSSLMPLFAAFALAYAFTPVANVLERRGWSRGAAALLLIAALALGLALAIWAIIPRLIDETTAFVADFPRYLNEAMRKAGELGERHGVKVPASGALDEVLKQFEDASFSSVAPAADVVKRIFSGAMGAALGVIKIFIVPVLFFYLVRSLPTMRDKTIALFPLAYQGLAERELDKIDRVFSGYIRGQLFVGAVLAAIFGVGLPLLGVKFGLFIGIVSGLLNIIPYVGQLAGCLLSLTIVLSDFTGWWRPAAVCLLFGLTNYLEGTFLSPLIVGDKVGLTPPQSIMALIVGGQVAGFLGLLIALPVAGSVKVLLLDLADAYRVSDLYRTGLPARHAPRPHSHRRRAVRRNEFKERL